MMQRRSFLARLAGVVTGALAATSLPALERPETSAGPAPVPVPKWMADLMAALKRCGTSGLVDGDGLILFVVLPHDAGVERLSDDFNFYSLPASPEYREVRLTEDTRWWWYRATEEEPRNLVIQLRKMPGLPPELMFPEVVRRTEWSAREITFPLDVYWSKGVEDDVYEHLRRGGR